jgi:hypothetical protein
MLFKSVVADDSQTIFVYGLMSFVINIIILIVGIISDYIMRRFKISDKANLWVLLGLFFVLNEIIWSTIYKEPVMFGLLGGNGSIVIEAKLLISLTSTISVVLVAMVTLAGKIQH